MGKRVHTLELNRVDRHHTEKYSVNNHNLHTGYIQRVRECMRGWPPKLDASDEVKRRPTQSKLRGGEQRLDTPQRIVVFVAQQQHFSLRFSLATYVTQSARTSLVLTSAYSLWAHQARAINVEMHCM